MLMNEPQDAVAGGSASEPAPSVSPDSPKVSSEEMTQIWNFWNDLLRPHCCALEMGLY